MPDSATASVSGTCTDDAGNASSPFGYGLKYDATAPVISGATPERPPNAAGWFNAPVRFDLQASDATSGIADCPAVAYSGPDSATASFSGSCHDRAGNASSRGFALKYDAMAPAVMDLTATPGNRSVSLSWRSASDAASVAVVRTPGVPPEPATVVFRGPVPSSRTTGRERGADTYEVRVQDAAENAGSDTVEATPSAAPAGCRAQVSWQGSRR